MNETYPVMTADKEATLAAAGYPIISRRNDGFIPSVKNPGQRMANEEYQDIAAKQNAKKLVEGTMSEYENPSVAITRPEYSDWQVHLMKGVTFKPKRNCEPNWFHRRMQELAFGVRWERVP